tara:strand:- start:5088 stop:5957 length:870 start_codon:yes stop_codon:yes gene_type:complete
MSKVYFGILGQFGDVVMQEPALRQFIKDNPDDKITIGCSLKYASALKLYENYHKNVVALKIFLDYNEFPTEEDVRYFENEKFDLVMIKKDSNKILFSDTGKLTQHPDPNWAKNMHQTIAAGLQQGINVIDTQIEFKKKFDLSVKDKYICFSLFPDYPNKGVKSFTNDQIEGIVKLINKLGYKAIHLNGPNEPDIPGSTKSNCDWLTSVGLITKSELLITGDTGLAWAASGFQHPTLGLYAWGYNPVLGSSKKWQPTNPNASYLESELASGIKPKDIIEQIINIVKVKNR